MNKIKVLGLIMLLFLSFKSFSQGVEAGSTHWIFIIDNTASMKGIDCCDNWSGGTHQDHNIWSEVKTKITGTISNLDVHQDNVISIYTFSGELGIRNFDNNTNALPIEEINFNASNQKQIIETINGIGATGKTTCIYNSFKMLIDKFVLDDGSPSKLLKQYDTKIYLYTDSEEACCEDKNGNPIPNCAQWRISCNQAFEKWCQIKQNQDFAQIIKLENSDASRLIDCLQESSNCVEVIEEPSTQTTIYIENKKSIKFSSEDLTENVQNRNSINLDHYPEAKAALSSSNYSIRFKAEEDCFSFTGQNEVDILEHTLSLANDCNLVSFQKVKGSFTYNEGDKVIYEDKDIKLVLKNPVVEFTFTNKAEPKITHDYRTN